MTDDIGATAAQGAFALTVFWVSLGVGRIVFGSLDRVLPERIVFRVLPFVAAVSLLLVALTPDGDVNLALAGFALTGLGCSALLPLAVTFSQTELVSVRSMMSGALVAFYMIGFGIASFGVGPLVEHLGMDPSLMYVAAAGSCSCSAPSPSSSSVASARGLVEARSPRLRAAPTFRPRLRRHSRCDAASGRVTSPTAIAGGLIIHRRKAAWSAHRLGSRASLPRTVVAAPGARARPNGGATRRSSWCRRRG